MPESAHKALVPHAASVLQSRLVIERDVKLSAAGKPRGLLATTSEVINFLKLFSTPPLFFRSVPRQTLTDHGAACGPAPGPTCQQSGFQGKACCTRYSSMSTFAHFSLNDDRQSRQ